MTYNFRLDVVAARVHKITASVPSLEKLTPWATWSLLRYCCINERINYLAQVTEFLSLARDDGRSYRHVHPARG